MRLWIARLCFALTLLAAALHLSTYFGFDPMTWLPELWTLHAAAMGAAASTIVSGAVRILPLGSNVLDRLDHPRVTDSARGRWASSAIIDENEFARVVRPNRRKFVAAALGAYAVINFFICLSILQGGQAVERGGRTQLESHGKVINTLTESQYRWDRAVQTRLATGHWLFAFYVSGALWIFTPLLTRPSV